MKLTIDRSQEHNRRCPPQLPHVPQIQAITFSYRCPVSPWICRRNHRWHSLCCRLQIGLGRNEILDFLGRACILYPQWGLDVLDMGSGKGQSIHRRDRSSVDRMANCMVASPARKKISWLTDWTAFNSLARHKAHSHLQPYSPVLQQQRGRKEVGFINAIHSMVRYRRLLHHQTFPAMACVRDPTDRTGGSQ